MGKTIIKKSDDGTRVFVEHQPGNGTRYVGFAFRVPEGVPDYAGQWVVSFPELGCSYYFHEGCHAHVTYVAEKLGQFRIGTKHGVESPDVHELAKMIAMMVPHASHGAYTDVTGHFPDDYSSRGVRIVPKEQHE